MLGLEFCEVVSEQGGGRGNMISPLYGSHPSLGRPSQGPRQHSAALRLLYPVPSSLSSTGFPPIPGLEPTAGTEEDAVAATLAAAQKLATSEDTALAEEDGDEV